MRSIQMDPDQTAKVSRRDAMRRGLVAVAGAGLNRRAAGESPAAPAKLPKSAVKYVEMSTDKGKDCDDCSQFVPGRSADGPGSCKLVEGEINPHGHCIAFSPKPGR